uniref:Chemokine interleukin-8-like domain-containing protein n=1 Tax=Laticauda laticaudata TaxID=8630 RepID=A0A8C5SC97_LATLA
ISMVIMQKLRGTGKTKNMGLYNKELRCQCVKVFSHGISTGSIASVDFIPEGPHCIRPEVIITRKDGKQFCLNTTMPWVQRVIQRFTKVFMKIV